MSGTAWAGRAALTKGPTDPPLLRPSPPPTHTHPTQVKASFKLTDKAKSEAKVRCRGPRLPRAARCARPPGTQAACTARVRGATRRPGSWGGSHGCRGAGTVRAPPRTPIGAAASAVPLAMRGLSSGREIGSAPARGRGAHAWGTHAPRPPSLMLSRHPRAWPPPLPSHSPRRRWGRCRARWGNGAERRVQITGAAATTATHHAPAPRSRPAARLACTLHPPRACAATLAPGVPGRSPWMRARGRATGRAGGSR